MYIYIYVCIYIYIYICIYIYINKCIYRVIMTEYTFKNVSTTVNEIR